MLTASSRHEGQMFKMRCLGMELEFGSRSHAWYGKALSFNPHPKHQLIQTNGNERRTSFFSC